MKLHFSEDGPRFPDSLVDSLMDGEVVFLCGAGISSPPLPKFPELVKRTCEKLNFDLVAGSLERRAFDDGRFEEVLGALSWKFKNYNELVRVISCLLAIPPDPYIERHHTLLRLSRDLENKICIVTTNFDTLLERAAATVFDNEKARKISSATQALPSPGSSGFSGIMHIHGRLADQELGLEESQLVLTGADYGDAYMRSGWAFRFLFDLARCRTIVLVGYSANDVPVRYFLNFLEIERKRFPDIRKVYAFDPQEHKPKTTQRESEELWGLLPAISLPYCKINPDSQKSDHMPLWRDLKKLANMIEHQERSYQDRTRTILCRSVAESGIKEYDELSWLFSKSRNIRSIPFDSISDPDWFRYFYENRSWSKSDLIQIIAVWIAENFQSVERFECALKWQERFDRPFTEVIQRFLRRKELDENWNRVWHLFCLAESPKSDSEDYHVIRKRFNSTVIFDRDLRKAVSLLAPKPEFRVEYHKFKEEYYKLLGETYDNTISDSRSLLSSVHMDISDSYAITDLLNLLKKMREHSLQILEIATSELRSSLALQADFVQDGQKSKDDIEYDPNDWQVPSIETHRQNQHRGGVNFLIQAIVNCIPQAKKLNLDYTKKIIIDWKRLPGRIGLRLYLHAMRDAELFSGDDAMSTLSSISITDFWLIRREIALLLRDQAKNASPKILRRVERRILTSGAAYYKRFPIEQGEVDWRRPAHDAAVWIRLKMLQESNPDLLSESGISRLSAIVKRRKHLDREVEDRDFFATYIHGVRKVIGDPTSIMDTPEDDRLRVAHELADSPDSDVREGWPAFCGIDPQGAFKILLKEDLKGKNSLLWGQFLGRLASNAEQNKEVRKGLSIQALDHLYQIDAKSLLPLAFVLCDLLSFAPREEILNFDDWLLKLWEVIKQLPDEPIEFHFDMYQKAINSPAGELSMILLKEIDVRKDKGLDLTDSQRNLIGSISANTGAVGYFGCCVFTHYLAFLFTVEQEYVIERIVPRIKANNDAGKALRDVMLKGTVTPEISNILKEEFLAGVIETRSDDHFLESIAVNIFRPILAIFGEGDQIDKWNLTANDMRRALREAEPAIWRAVLSVLVEWLQTAPSKAEGAWGRVVVPFFRKIWPGEQEVADPMFTSPMIDLIVATGQKFPEALEFIQPYICPYTQGRANLVAIKGSDVLKKFPQETLKLVWLVCGPGSRGEFYDLSDVIDELVQACPSIEIDRRLQWLKRRAQHDGS